MAHVHDGIWSSLQARDLADCADADTATAYYNQRSRLFAFSAAETRAENNARPGLYILRPHDNAAPNPGAWVEVPGNDYDVINGGQIIGSVIYSTNWIDGTSGMKIDLDNGLIAVQDDTFGNKGIQFDYNSGSPRAYVGDGANVFWNFDGSHLTISVDSNAGTGVGVLYKGGKRWLYDFNPVHNGSVQPDGYNLFLGIEAGNLNIGSTAILSIQASHNVGVGYQSAYSLTTGFQNIGIGFKALYSAESSALNIAIGTNALYSLSGSYDSNIGIGTGALYYGTQITTNIAIGTWAGMTYGGAGSHYTQGSGSIFIGYSARPKQDNSTREIVIGYDAVGNGSNTVTLGDSNILANYLYGALYFTERTSEPGNPVEGQMVIWMSNGTGAGDDGDVMIKSTAGSTTKTGTLFDHSAA